MNDVEVITQEDFDEAVANHLKVMGISMEELKEQAATDDFISERARRLWFWLAP